MSETATELALSPATGVCYYVARDKDVSGVPPEWCLPHPGRHTLNRILFGRWSMNAIRGPQQGHIHAAPADELCRVTLPAGSRLAFNWRYVVAFDSTLQFGSRYSLSPGAFVAGRHLVSVATGPGELVFQARRPIAVVRDAWQDASFGLERLVAAGQGCAFSFVASVRFVDCYVSLPQVKFAACDFAVTQGDLPVTPTRNPLSRLLRQAWRVLLPF